MLDALGLEPSVRKSVGVEIPHRVPNYWRVMKTKYGAELIGKLVKESASVTEVCKKLGLKIAGGNNSHIKKIIKLHQVDTSHFLGQRWNVGRTDLKRLDHTKILINDGQFRKGAMLKRAMVEVGIEYMCSSCPIYATWNGQPLALQVDHIDGDNTNNDISNLRFLCPNCHSQTPTFAGKKNKKCSSG